MNRKACWSILCVVFIMALGACGGSGTKTPPPVEEITVQSGSGQSTVVSTAFGAPLVALVSTGGTPNSGVVVTFTAPSSGASGTFSNSSGGTLTATATTGANGEATSPVFTANATVGGPFTVTAAAAGVTATASFSFSNTAVVVTTSNFTFYLNGEFSDNNSSGFLDFYALAGTVTIDSNGNVDGGVQDFNDGDFVHSPSTGDTITGGTLVEDPTTGQGTLTLITSNTALGDSGTETLGVQFVNPNHALVIEFDDSATSSGSMDLQTLPSPLAPPTGGFAFTLTGVDTAFNSLTAGGVFTVNASGSPNLTAGIVDTNDAGFVSPGQTFTGTVSAPNSFGRGTITNTEISTTIAYYIVGPEALRLIDIDSTSSSGSGTGSLSGSAFGQGAGGFDNTSLGASIFNLESNVYGFAYAAVGEFTTSAAAAVKAAAKPQGIILSANFNGYGDNNEEGSFVAAEPISGTYSIGTNGYGSMTFTDGLQDISSLGIYIVDPTLNTQDPNNTTTGLGGALVADLDGDESLAGIGIAIPQTDTATASFTGNYAFGAQVLNGDEVDFVGQGTVTDGALVGTGLLNDPFDALLLGIGDDVTVTGTADPDIASGAVGRYTIFATPLTITVTNSGGQLIVDSAAIYQANGGQLLWIDEDEDELFGGSLQQQSSLPITPAIKKAAAKTNIKPKPKG